MISITSNLENITYSYWGSTIINPKGIIFSVDTMDQIGTDWEELPFWTPTHDQIIELEKRLQGYLEKHQPINDHSVENVFEYGRQYWGLTRKGRKLIYVNAFCNPDDFTPRLDWSFDWRKNIVRVRDGGSCYFQAYYDPIDKTFIELNFNGNT